MHVLSSPIHYIRLRRARTKQKQTALHMLSLSGVLRPSHVELRYTTPIASITAFRTADNSDRASADPTYPVAVMEAQPDAQHETDMAMGEQPVTRPCPTCEKTDRTSVDQAVRLVGLHSPLREFFLIHLANRLYLPHGLR